MELRKAHAANDASVLKAYGWPTSPSRRSSRASSTLSLIFDRRREPTNFGIICGELFKCRSGLVLGLWRAQPTLRKASFASTMTRGGVGYGKEVV